MPEPHPSDAFRPTSAIFWCVLAGVIAANVPLMLLWGFKLTWYWNVIFEAMSPSLLGCALSAFACQLHAGVDPRRALDRMTFVIATFPFLAFGLAVVLFILADHLVSPGFIRRDDPAILAVAIMAYMVAALLAVAVSLRRNHPRWTWLTRLCALAGTAVLVLVIARPIVNAVGIAAGSRTPLFSEPEAAELWRLEERLTTPT